MKDVRQCSISSVAFTLEVDAYQELHNYLESIRVRLAGNADGEEILSDIEARIAELILSVNAVDRVVAKPLIDNIISQLGSVDDICADEPSVEGEPSSEEAPKSKAKRHLYRNVDDASIGGVCSGIAAYVGCNVGIVRFISLLLLFFGGASIWVYFVLWIVMPAAVTARQKLEMRGEPITVNTINEFYNSVANNEANRSFFSSVLAVIGRIFMVLFKIVIACLLISLVLALITVAIGGVVLIAVRSDFNILWWQVTISAMALSSIAILLGLGIYASAQILNSRRIKISVIITTLVICFLLSVLTAFGVALYRNDLREMQIEARELLRGSQITLDDDDLEKLFRGEEISEEKMKRLRDLDIIFGDEPEADSLELK